MMRANERVCQRILEEVHVNPYSDYRALLGRIWRHNRIRAYTSL